MRLDDPERGADLALYMSELSEDYWCAGWLSGLEYSLWRAVLDGPREFGLGMLTEDEIRRLKELSAACGGWVAWFDRPEPGYSGEQFVPMDEWLTMFAAEEARLAAKAS